MGLHRYDEDGIDQVKEECQGVMALMEVEHVSTSVSHTLWGVQDGLLIWSSKLGMDGLVVWASNRGPRRRVRELLCHREAYVETMKL